MVKRNVVLFLIILVVNISKLSGQVEGSRSYSIGDTLPDFEINNIINYNSSSIKFSQSGADLVILDFWATWCTPCISAFPKLDLLKKEFKNRLQVISVTSENTKVVRSFLKKMELAKGLRPLTVTADTLLSKCFPHVSLPHYVWLNKDRIVLAITDSKEVTSINVKRCLDDQRINLNIKNDFASRVVSGLQTSIKVRKGKTVADQVLPDSGLLVQSILTSFIEGKTGGFSFTDSTQIEVSNGSLQRLYKIALLGNKIDLVNSRNVILDVSDSALYYKLMALKSDGSSLKGSTEIQEWKKEYTFCYRLKVPKHLAKRRFEIMMDDLNKYFEHRFGIKASLENIQASYLALIKETNNMELFSNGGKPFSQIDKFSFEVRNQTLAFVIANLALPLQEYPPIVDETGYKGKLDMKLNCEISELTELNNELRRYGLQLIEKQKPMNVVVLRKS